MPTPGFAPAGQRAIARFGGRGLPVTGALQPFIDLNDLGAWMLQDYDIGDSNRQIGAAQLRWLARGVYLSDDFGAAGVGRIVKLVENYYEGTAFGGSGNPLAQQLGQLSQAGEQYLTFDNKTYLLAKLKGVSGRKLMVPNPPYWWRLNLEFVCREPWARDFQLSGSLANLLNPNGGFENGNITGWASGVDSGTMTFAQSSVAHSGTKSASIAANPSGSGFWATPAGTSGIAASGGATYALGGWINLASVTGTGAYFRIMEYDSGGVLVKDWGSTLMTPVTGTQGWTYYASTFTTQSATAFLRVVCQLNATGGTAYFDDVVLQETFDNQTGLYAAAFVDQVPLAGSAGAGTATAFTITNPGSVWAEPLWQVTIPATNTAAISAITIFNQTTGLGLTVNFSPALAASTAYTFQVDCGALTATIGSQPYDWSTPGAGSLGMPYLVPGANAMTATIATSSGTTTGVVLDSQWTNRWEL